jgi:hypothetical protein
MASALLSALISFQQMVNEITTGILGTLPLAPRAKSKPFIPM